MAMCCIHELLYKCYTIFYPWIYVDQQFWYPEIVLLNSLMGIKLLSLPVFILYSNIAFVWLLLILCRISTLGTLQCLDLHCELICTSLCLFISLTGHISLVMCIFMNII